MSSHNQNQFDELLHQKLTNFCDDPDEGLIDKIHLKKDRIISLYRLMPFIISVIGIIALTGLFMFTSHEETKPALPADKSQALTTVSDNKTKNENQKLNFSSSGIQTLIPSNTPLSSDEQAIEATHTQTSLSNLPTTHAVQEIKNGTTANGNEFTAGQKTCAADFDFYTSYTGELFFTNSTEISGDASLIWNFGDGSTSADQHPSHQYKQDGKYSVSLQYYSQGKYICAASKEITYTANPPLRQRFIKGNVFENLYISRDAMVSLYKENTTKGIFELVALAKTDATGGYVFNDLVDGKYMLLAQKSDNTSFAATWYGNVLNAENADRITIDERDLQNGKIFDINLLKNNLSDPLDLSIQKTDTGGAYVVLMDRFNNVIGTFKTDRNGNLMTGNTKIPPGTYKIINPNSSEESTIEIGADGTGNIDPNANLIPDNKAKDETKALTREEPLKIMPNPAINDIRFEVKLETYQQILVRIINSNGVEVHSETTDGIPGTNTFNVMISSFPPGVYYVIVKKGQSVPVISQLVKANQ